MKLPRKITATAISTLALVLGITTIQAPSVLAADRTLQAPIANPAFVTGGQEVSFVFLGPTVGDLVGSTRVGVGRIVLRQGGKSINRCSPGRERNPTGAEALRSGTGRPRG